MPLTALKNRMQEETSVNSDGSATESEDADTEANAALERNASWADSIAKVLSTTKPKAKKTLVLSRAKKLKPDVEVRKKNYDFDIEGETKQEQPHVVELGMKTNQRRNVPLKLRTKPSWRDIERERTLRKIATRGVVQLFNAVRMQQKDLQEQLAEAGPLDSRRDAVLNNINKRKFLDMLMSGNRAKSVPVDNGVKTESKNETSSDDESEDGHKKSQWSVLREDFMTNKNAKHWDEDSDEGEISDFGQSDGTEGDE